MDISRQVAAQRTFFASGATLELSRRKDALLRLQKELLARETQIEEALKADLNKSPFESFMCELGMVLDELHYALSHMEKWAKPRRVPTPFSQFPGKSRIYKEPFGCVLIMAPWNYPLLLSLEPLIGAVAAGNCVVLKPSAYAPHTSRVLAELIKAAFSPEYVWVVEGGREENQLLLEERFDFIFFTGSVSVGKTVMAKASRFLTPIALELGGKSPCIIDETADLPLAARRLAFGKLLNAGQTCVAPDYVLVHHSVREELLNLLKENIQTFLGEHPEQNPEFPRIINAKHFQRLTDLLEAEKSSIWFGGETNGKDTIAPTLVLASPDSPSMEDEIFGPILPILSYQDPEEAFRLIRSREKPLALYLFTRDKAMIRRVIREVSFGGGCVNDTIVHLASHHLPFGGVGSSGMGSYHGRKSFETFTHEKSILHRGLRPDLTLRYHPYTPEKFRLLKKVLK